MPSPSTKSSTEAKAIALELAKALPTPGALFWNEAQTRNAIGGIGRSKLWGEIRAGRFPAPFKIMGRSLWNPAQVTEWAREQMQARK